METFHPTLNRILVLPDPVAEKSEGGLHLAEVAQEIPVTGTVIAIGPDAKTLISASGFRPMMSELWLEIGSRVVYGKYSGTEITLNKVKHLVLTEKDILGVLVTTAVEPSAVIESDGGYEAAATSGTMSPIDTAPAGAL